MKSAFGRPRGRILSRLPVVLLALGLASCSSVYDHNYVRVGDPPAVYEVGPGDTLYSIAWRHGLDFRSVARWNRIDPPYTIFPNQRLHLQAPAKPTRRATAERAPAAPSPKPAPAAKPRIDSKPTPLPVADLAWRWPVEGSVVRSFSARSQGKQGIEIAGAIGQTVHAAAAGRIVYSGNGLRGYGNLVIVKHNGRYLTAYGYNSRLLVKEGDTVKAGQEIALMGPGSGEAAGLHFEVRRDGQAVDPISYLPKK